MANITPTDKHFFNSFSLILGILIVVAIVLFALARMIGMNSQGANLMQEPLRLKDIQQNIAPVAQVAIAGRDNSALAIAVAPGAANAAAVPATGEQAFTSVCSACHSSGINGAPKTGDHVAWAPRLAQGKEAMYGSAIGGKGNMPPRGGTTWPDATIRMAVDYMVALNK